MNKPALLAVFALLAAPAYAQQESADEAQQKPAQALEKVEEVVVTASPLGKTQDQLAGSVNLLYGDELRQHAAATIGETLRSQLGISSASFGGGVGLPVIRGMSGKRVVNLQNGLGTGDVSSSSLDHAVGVEALMAERIEILRGPATLRYGGGAIGGVVNVIDYRIAFDHEHELGGIVELRHDTNNSENSLLGRFESFGAGLHWHVGGLTRSSDNVEIPGIANPGADEDERTKGFIGNSDRKADAYNFAMSWDNENFLAGLSVSNISNNYGLPPGTHAHHDHEEGEEGGEEEEHHEETVRLDIDHQVIQGKLQWRDISETWQSVSVDLSSIAYEHVEATFEENGSRTDEAPTLYDADSTEVRVEAIHTFAGWEGALGAQLTGRDFVIDGEEAFVPASNTKAQAVFLVESKAFGAGTLDLGVRLETQSISRTGAADIDHDTFNLSAGWVQKLNSRQRFGISVANSERAPNAEELLSDGHHIATNAYEIGTQTLKNEGSLGIDFSWTYEGAITATVSVFRNAFSDYIYLHDTEKKHDAHQAEEDGLKGLASCFAMKSEFEEPDEFADAVECFVWRQQDATFTGFEAEVRFDLAENQQLRVWGDSVRAEFAGGGNVPRIPASRIGVDYNFSTGPWSLQASITSVSDQNRFGTHDTATKGYTRFDVYGSYDAERWSVFVKGNNLTDEEIRNAASLTRRLAPEPGRSISVGANFLF